MHDGRFATINQVLEHYSTGIQPNPNLDQELKDFNTGLPKKFNISEYDKQALIAFFGTLTDSVMLVDPKFSDPFK
jgi:cytochrome c peroxidase